MKKSELVSYLDTYLDIRAFDDDSRNGIQIENISDEITHIATATDASTFTVELARAAGAHMLIVHHGVYWGREQPLTGTHYALARAFLDGDLALYACHLPLDAHPDIGNNVVLMRTLCEVLGFSGVVLEPFWEYHGQMIGFAARLPAPVSMANFQGACQKIGLTDELYNFSWKTHIASIACMTGGAARIFSEAYDSNYDIFITGEGVHHERLAAAELGQSMFLGGHYETETFGVRALGDHLAWKFGIQHTFIDKKYR